MNLLSVFKNLVLTNWAYKIGGLVISLSLFSFVHFEQDAQITKRVDLRWDGIPANRMIMDENLPEIRMVLEGPGTLLRQVQDRPLIFDASVAELVLGQNLVRINSEAMDIPRGVQIRRISPAAVEVEYLEVETKELPIQVRYVGDVAEGYRLAQVRIAPSVAVVTARKGDLDGVTFLTTKPIELTNRASGFEATADLALGGMKVKDIQPKTFKAQVEIVPSSEVRVFKNVAVQVRGAVGGSYELMPTSVELTLVGPSGVLDKLAGTLIGYIDVPDSMKIDRAVPFKVSVDLPEAVTLQKTSPELVAIRAR